MLYHEKNTIDNAMSKKNKIILLDELDEGFKKKEIQSKYNSIALIVKKTKKKFTKKVFGLILFTNHIIYYLVLFNEQGAQPIYINPWQVGSPRYLWQRAEAAARPAALSAANTASLTH